MPAPQLVMQTTYAELLERSANAAFNDAFAEDGAFIAKTIKGPKLSKGGATGIFRRGRVRRALNDMLGWKTPN
jgi:hypothetical protein